VGIEVSQTRYRGRRSSVSATNKRLSPRNKQRDGHKGARDREREANVDRRIDLFPNLKKEKLRLQ
jgi:hypothetical protein